MELSIVVPSYNCIPALRQCLAAIQAQIVDGMEILVVDDASTDATPAAAADFGVRVLRAPHNGGPGWARNLGAAATSGDILLFIDSDVVIGPGALNRVVETFRRRREAAALFGSHDDQPTARGLVSSYRNLLHHYTHQTGNPDAATFWAGLGAVRRHIFLDVGGFDEKRYCRPSIEDIELGYRLRRAGHSIVLDRLLQAKHLKEWTLKSVVITDVFCRAIPWARLTLERDQAVADLNLKFGQRASGALSLTAALLAPLSWTYPAASWVVAAAILSVVGCNFGLYAFFRRTRGFAFALGCVPLHFLYFLYSTLSYLYVRADHFLGRAPDIFGVREAIPRPIHAPGRGSAERGSLTTTITKYQEGQS